MCIHVNSHVRVCAITSLTMTTQLKDETILEHVLQEALNPFSNIASRLRPC